MCVVKQSGVESADFIRVQQLHCSAEAGQGESWPPRVEVGLRLEQKAGSFGGHMHCLRELPFRLSFSLPDSLFLEGYLV